MTQGSVATYMRCGGIFSDSVVTNFFFDSGTEKNCENQLLFDEVKANKVMPSFGPLSIFASFTSCKQLDAICVIKVKKLGKFQLCFRGLGLIPEALRGQIAEVLARMSRTFNS